jgi:hypothetical protein
MLAKGMVFYQNRWMSPDEKFRVQQGEKGLAEYKGQWLPKEEAYANEQKDKGLVLFEGKWITPEQRLQAQGFVLFEDKWMTKEQQEAIIAQRVAKKKEADELATARKNSEAKASRMGQLAYEKSQEFLKQKLSAGAAATFAAYGDPGITVVLEGGWYLLRAPVQFKKDDGTKMSRDYICQLRPAQGNDWECKVVGWAPAK